MPEKQKRPGFVSRAVAAGRRAATINEADRSVEFIAATEDPVVVWDWESWDAVSEILLMSGRVEPPTGQVPLLDTHNNCSVTAQIGSFRDIRTEGPNTVGRVCVSSNREDVWTMLREGHLTDCSVGYIINTCDNLREGESKDYNGRAITGPCRVVTSWELKELSLCPIGADPGAKARADKMKEDLMKKNKGRMEATAEEKEELEDEIQSVIEDVAAGDITEAEAEAEAAAVIDEVVDEESGDEEAAREDDDEEKKEERAARSGALAERRRVKEIEEMCRAVGLPEGYRRAFINRGVTAEQARKAIFKRMLKKGQSGPGFYGDVRVGSDERENFKARALDSLLLRAGRKVEKPAPGAAELRGYTLRELARECLRRAGQREPSHVVEMVGRALTTTDLPILLTEAANRSLLEGFEAATETWPLWTGEASVNDFREITLVDAAIDNNLEEIGEHDEYTFTEMAEEAEKARVVTYGRMFGISRQAIINDDLNALVGIPAKMGAGANKKVGDGVYAVLIANSAMADGSPLFSGAHNNLLTANGGIPDVAKLGRADTAMGLQRDMAGNRLNIRPDFFLAPVSLRVSAETFFNSEMIGTQAQPGVRNMYSGAFTRIYEPRLDDDSADNWYLVGPRQMGVRVIYLNGLKEPYLETREGWNIDGVEHKVRFDVGVKAVSWRALNKSQN